VNNSFELAIEMYNVFVEY